MPDTATATVGETRDALWRASPPCLAAALQIREAGESVTPSLGRPRLSPSRDLLRRRLPAARACSSRQASRRHPSRACLRATIRSVSNSNAGSDPSLSVSWALGSLALVLDLREELRRPCAVRNCSGSTSPRACPCC